MKNQISVEISGYNCQDTIISVLDSYKVAINKLNYLLDIEILYIDDASNDQSIELVQKYAQKNQAIDIRIIKHKTNQSCARTRKTAAKYAKYDFICFMDADDYVMDNFFNVIARQNQSYDIFILQTLITSQPCENLIFSAQKYENEVLSTQELIDDRC